jgi:hypothetical protein
MALVVAAAALLAGAAQAAAQDVSYNAMPGADFAKFKTYRWVNVENGQQADQITDRMIKTAIDAELAKKGLKMTDATDADLYVGYQAAIQHQTEWNAYNMGGVGWGYRMGGMATATSSTIDVGMLDVDLYDRAAKELVWKGAASKTIDSGASPEKRQANITKAVEKMMKNYPPPKKK